MSVRLTTLPSLAVIGAVVLLGSTGATVGGVLITGSDRGGAVSEHVKEDSPRTHDLARDTRIKLRRTRERVPAAD